MRLAGVTGHSETLPPAWRQPLSITYFPKPGGKGPDGKPVQPRVDKEVTAVAPTGSAPDVTGPVRVEGDLAAAVAWAAAAARARAGTVHDAHAVLQARDGALYVAGLVATSFGTTGPVSIDGPYFRHVIDRFGVHSAVEGVVAIVGGDGWIPVVARQPQAYQPLPRQT